MKPRRLFAGLFPRLAIPIVVELLLLIFLLAVLTTAIYQQMDFTVNDTYLQAGYELISDQIHRGMAEAEQLLVQATREREGAIPDVWQFSAQRMGSRLFFSGNSRLVYVALESENSFSMVLGSQERPNRLSDYTSYTTKDWYAQAVQYNKTIYSFVGGVSSGTEPSVIVARPDFSPDGSFRGVLALYIPLRTMFTSMKSSTVLSGLTVDVTDWHGSALFSLPTGPESVSAIDLIGGADIGRDLDAMVRLRNSMAGREGRTYRYRYGRGIYYLRVVSLGLDEDSSLLLALVADASLRNTGRRQVGYFLGISMLVAVIIFAVTLGLFERLVRRPLEEMGSAALDLSRGGRAQRFSSRHKGEIGVLATALNDIGRQLAESRTNVEQMVQDRTRALMDNQLVLERSLTELSETQGNLLESQKLAAIGGLVAALTHDLTTPIGNGITAITSRVEEQAELERSLESGDLTKAQFAKHLSENREFFGVVLANLQRASELIGSFKKIAADNSMETSKFSLNELLNNMKTSLSPLLRKLPVELKFEGVGDVTLNTNSGMLWQICSNLVLNALHHAFPDRRSGIIVLRYWKEAENFIMRVEDDGVGIPEDIREHIFEPFYTTARTSGGTGLGLHIVSSIVRDRMNGEISLVSSSGSGTVFTVNLPSIVL